MGQTYFPTAIRFAVGTLNIRPRYTVGTRGNIVRNEIRELGRNTRFRRLVAARVVSNLGNGLTPIALAFGVLELDGADAGSLSLVTTAQMVPLVAFLLLGGVVADRFGRSQMVGITDMVASALFLLSGLSFVFDFASIPLLCVNGFVIGILNALWYPAFSGLMPEVVPTEQLQSANSIVGLGANLSFTLGASAAGVMVSTVGPGWAIIVDAITFFVAGILVFGLRLPEESPIPHRADFGDKRLTIVAQLKEGWVEFSSRRWIVVVVCSFSFYVMAWEGFLGVLAPVQSKDELGGAGDMSLMMLGFGSGAIVGTLVALRVRPKHPMRLAVMVMPTLALWMFALAVPLPLWMLFLAAFLTGIEFDLFYALWITSLQTHVPDEALSRVGSYDAFGSTLFAPLGLFLAGPLAHWVGVRPTMIGAGVIVVVVSLVALSSKSVRSLERLDPRPL